MVRIVQRLREEKRGPSPAELAVLRNAVRDAHHNAGLGTLEAASAQIGDDTSALTPEGLRVLSFLDHADESKLPVEAMIRLLTLTVDETATPEATTSETTTSRRPPRTPPLQSRTRSRIKPAPHTPRTGPTT